MNENEHDKLAQIGEAIARIETKIDTLTDDQTDMKHIVYGNGAPGLKGKVAANETELSAHIEQTQWRERTIMGTLAGIALTGAVAVAVWIIRIMPHTP